MWRDFRARFPLVAAAAGFVALCACRKAAVPPPAVHAVDAAGMARSTRPGEDFSKYANGKWDQETAIPADHAAWGIGAILDEQAREQTRVLLETARSQAAAGSDERKAADYYAAYMNEAALEARGLATLKPELD